ncbi:hypothetical protein LPB87_20700, partial [Flavobacterium sp. EDS]
IAPLLRVMTAPTCANVLGSFSIDNYDANYTYTVTPLIGVTQNGGIVTAPSGSYTVIATLGSCSSGSSSDIVMTNVICANTETAPSINGNTGGTTATLVSNDTLN